MKRLVFLFAIFFALVSYAQIGTVSRDGKLLATLMLDQGVPKIFIHDIGSGKLVQKIRLQVQRFEKLEFSTDSKFLLMSSGGTLYIYRRSDGRLIKKYYRTADYALAGVADRVFVISNGMVYSYDLNGLQETKYGFYPKRQVVKILAAPDGKFFTAKTIDNHLVVWRYGKASPLKTLSASDALFSGSHLITRADKKLEIEVKFFALPATVRDSLTLIRKTSARSLLQKAGVNANLLVTDKSVLSPGGSKIALFTENGYRRSVLVFDLKNQNKIAQISNNQNLVYTLYPIHWTGQSLILETGDLNGLRLDLQTGQISRLYWEMFNPNKSPKLAPSEQLKKRRFSPDYRYVVMPVYQGARKFLLVRDATVDKRQISYPDANFIAFSPDSRQLFLEVKGFVFVLNTSEIKNSMILGRAATLQQLGSSLSGQVGEALIPKDQPPPGYKYVFSTKIEPVTKVDTAKLFVLFRGMNINPDNVELKLNLVDQNGNIITGATDPQWLYLWCKLLIMNKSLKVDQSNFVVREVRENQPTAYALVLDHSGSMGDFRANALQFGALQLIKYKKPKDAFLLIKYDNRVKLLVNLTTNPGSFYKYLNNTGLEGFGGGTALNDAAYLAIEKLSKAPYRKRVLILFTDGKENSSLHTKEQVILAARKNNVEIFTIGFGRDVNDQYLMDLAYLTGGAYYHIYKTEDLRRIFRDVDIKRRYYYKFDFTTDQPGKYIALLQLCQNFKHHDSLIVEFDNDPKTPITQKHIRPNPPLSPIQKQKLKKLQIPRRPPDKPVTDKKIVEEFQNIDFPNIYFAFDSDRIIKSEEKGIIEIAEFMRRHPDVYLLIEGHTDSVGSYEYNIDLSKRRAEAAKRLLVKYGIAPGRIFTKGYGYTRPLDTNKTEEGRAKNRRIEFKIFRYEE